ncbi:MAG TPA: hypothetical protein VMN82_04560, partial [Thermoanaerobaculia bacterium]|nr:hypothetical protein [Thermoanaerobaculia bacterium]
MRRVLILLVLGGFVLAGTLRAEGTEDAPAADLDLESGVPAMLLSPEHARTQHLSDLSIGNFFTAGWDQDWSKWRHYTPDM